HHLSGGHAHGPGASFPVQGRDLQARRALPRRGADPRVPREPAPLDAQGRDPSHTAHLHRALRRAARAHRERGPRSIPRACPPGRGGPRMSPREKFYWLIGGIAAVLLVASIAGRILRLRVKDEGGRAVVENLVSRVRAWWVMIGVFVFAYM